MRGVRRAACGGAGEPGVAAAHVLWNTHYRTACCCPAPCCACVTWVTRVTGHTPLDVSDFMRMIKNPSEYEQFANHLRKEHGDDGLKLRTDLKFWIEIQR